MVKMSQMEVMLCASNMVKVTSISMNLKLSYACWQQTFLMNLQIYSKRSRLLQVIKLAKLILVLPANNATSKSSFSALRRLKTYLRTTITQNHLNHLMMLYVHKEVEQLGFMVKFANEFVFISE